MKPKKKLTEADVRGLVALRRGALRQTPEGRFIPARAGNTSLDQEARRGDTALMDTLRCIGWVLAVPVVAFGAVVVWVAFATMIEEAPHLLLLMAALAVPAYLGLKALERALRPKLLGGRRQ